MGCAQPVTGAPSLPPARVLLPGAGGERQAARVSLVGRHGERAVVRARAHRVDAGRPAGRVDVSLSHPGASCGRHDGALQRGAPARYWCTELTTTPPSPTADATRFTEPLRTSPTANTPARVVSYRNGARGAARSGHSGAAAWLVRMKPRSSCSMEGGSHAVR